MSLCRICKIRKASVPDRYRMGRPIKRICAECHLDQLRRDARRIIEAERDRDRVLSKRPQMESS